MFSGVADEVLAIMKYSYDYSENEKLKSCFLYFSVYPEDYSIWKEELIKLWIGEESLDEVDDIEEAYIRFRTTVVFTIILTNVFVMG